MKKVFLLPTALATVLLFSACGSAQVNKTADLDLTQLSDTLAYSELVNITSRPSNYIGKTIRLKGQNMSFYSDETGTEYHAVFVNDATSCCAQGLEYCLADTSGYPAGETEITVTGTLTPYEEMGRLYYHLSDAAWTAEQTA